MLTQDTTLGIALRDAKRVRGKAAGATTPRPPTTHVAVPQVTAKGVVVLPTGCVPTMSVAASVHGWRFGAGLRRVEVLFRDPTWKGEDFGPGVAALVVGFPGVPGSIDLLARVDGRYVGPVLGVVKTFQERAPKLAKRLVELVTLFGDDPSGVGIKGDLLARALEGKLDGVKLTVPEIGFLATWHGLLKASDANHRVDSWRESFRAWFFPNLIEERIQLRAKSLFKASAATGKGKVVVAPGGSSTRIRQALFAPPFAARAIVETRGGIEAFVVARGTKEGLVVGALEILFSRHEEEGLWCRIRRPDVIIYLLRKGQETRIRIDEAMNSILANF